MSAARRSLRAFHSLHMHTYTHTTPQGPRGFFLGARRESAMSSSAAAAALEERYKTALANAVTTIKGLKQEKGA